MLAHSTESHGVRAEIEPSRWQEAQSYERAFWHHVGDGIESGARPPLDWYGWRAGELTRMLEGAGVSHVQSGRVLEIGSGPIGIVNFLDGPERFALDPLEPFYRTRPSLVSLRRPGVTYLHGTGESLPFEAESCSLIILDNVIDHTYAPRGILDQIHRVLTPGGVLYLSVNVHTVWGAAIHGVLATLHIDKGHPFTYTASRLRRTLADASFTVVAERIDDYRTARQEDRRSPHLRDRIKGYTGLTEFCHAVLCRKSPGAGVR
jgi:SAM-dependent methyltransferase